MQLKKKYLLFLVFSMATAAQAMTSFKPIVQDSIKHVKVIYQEGKYAGWPANWGIWNWGDEILVSYTFANHSDTVKSHSYDKASSVNKFSRSLDGGLTWTTEDATKAGIMQETFEHHTSPSAIDRELSASIDFKNKDFALAFRMKDEFDAGSSFYYSYNRGKSWEGPFKIKVNGPAAADFVGTVTRTDYLIEGKHQMTAFFTVGFRKDKQNWRNVACMRTNDGGKSWNFVSWVGENMIMPASLRLSKNELLTIVRRAKPAELLSFYSVNNGKPWEKRSNPAKVDMNGHPGALVKLKDGTLCLFYALRFSKTNPAKGNGMYAIYSKDQGKTWSVPKQIRGGDGANWDIGYPRAIVKPDGKIVLCYYYNHADSGNKYRYIAASIIDPQIFR